MALDSALYTLHFVRRQQHPWIVDLYQANLPPPASAPPPVPKKDHAGYDEDDRRPKAYSGTIPDRSTARRNLVTIDYSNSTPVYTRHRATNSARYSSILLDGVLSDCLLASIAALSTSVKTKAIQLHNPDLTVTIDKRTKTFHQDWRFSFEDHIFQWSKESSAKGWSAYTCEVIRKPDPRVLAAQYRPSTKTRPGLLSLMEYNLDRLELNDKRGLQVLLVMTLSSLLDQEYDEKRASNGEPNMYVSRDVLPSSGSSDNAAAGGTAMAMHTHSALGYGRVDSMSAPSRRGTALGSAGPLGEATAELEPNEVLVTHWGTVEDYVDHCLGLLRTDEVRGKGKGRGMYMIVLRSDSVETTPKTVQVAAAVKAAYYRLPDEAKGTVFGNSSSEEQIEDELYQYVRTEEVSSPAAVETDDPVSSTASASASTASTAAATTSRASAAAPKRRIIKLDPPKPASPGSSPSPRHGSLPSAAAVATGTKGSSSGGQSTVPGSRSSYLRPTPPSNLKIILSKERIGELEPPKQPEPWDPSLTALQEGPPSRSSLTAPMIPTRPRSISPRPASGGPQASSGSRPTDYVSIPSVQQSNASGGGDGQYQAANLGGGGSGTGEPASSRGRALLSRLGLGSGGGQ